ncbi:acyl-CoA thioesterase [Ilumatobacter nonamiensis]|uniref:acyl-CoA thioesterase n=1 Tax=Ilumatobacter nonamiensis TaxID=467093 RepID=UPI000347DCE6|nr:thioesterase family protein [Ilumatobacter nonamiensis]
MTANENRRFDLLDLESTEDEHRYRLAVRADLATPFGFLYGGSGIAAAAEAAERATGRPLQWITTQFIGSPAPGSVIDLQVTIPANGRATTQSQVVATIDGDLVFTALCAHTIRESGDGEQFVVMPKVASPDECSTMHAPFEIDVSDSFFRTMERRLGSGSFGMEAVGQPQHGGLSMWCRIVDDVIGSPATQAYVADIIPMGIGAALGAMPGATSVDNTLRVIDPEPSEWVLLELIPEGFHRSLGHGSLRVWSEDGRLMATAQQTCIVRTSHHHGG